MRVIHAGGAENLLVSGSVGFNLMYSQWLIRLAAWGKYNTKKRTGVKRLLYEFPKLLQQEDRLTQERANRSSMRADIS
jgi:hypothetical protein